MASRLLQSARHGALRACRPASSATVRCSLTAGSGGRSTLSRHLATPANPPLQPPSPVDAFATGSNAYYIEEMYKVWRKDPSAVHPSWNIYFSGMDKGLKSEQAYVPPPGLVTMPMGGTADFDVNAVGTDLEDHMKVQLLVRAYQVRGHHKAKLDPLELGAADLSEETPAELTIQHYGWSEKDLDKEIALGSGIMPRFKSEGYDRMTIREIIQNLERIYCGSIGIQYIHIPEREQCDWLRERVEVPAQWQYSVDEKRMILDRLIWSDSFERFIASKYPNEKRFGLEGCETLIPGMKALIDRSVDAGVNSAVIGMPHRGRLNVLCNVIRKPTEAIFSEFKGVQDEEGGGDVKYHLGANYVRPTPSGKKVALSLVANPSHLEAEDPVVLGKVKAIQHFDGEGRSESALGILLHGDAAFAGQGIVYETMGFHNLPNYSTGGTIHLIVNNQIGFTTDPRNSRSTAYCSDIAKAIDAPILHVNGDDTEAVNFVCQLAADWRAQFKTDVVVDIVCYRKHGHNETDQPMFTQPLMYSQIAKQETTLTKYSKQLADEGSFTIEEINKHKEWVWSMLVKAFEDSKDYQTSSREWLSSSWEGFPSPKELKDNVLEARPTGVKPDILRHIGSVISQWPEGFEPHKNLARIIKARGKTIEEGKGIDYSTAEALAFGSLAMEGNHVRLSGQDVERGTFSQRHAILHDQKTAKEYMALSHLSPEQAQLTISNSSLSEYGDLGFELGYSLVDPALLVIWEAQFGDFANNAQCIIDQFVASGERKWLQRTGLVMSLPHGYDGQGPEHSSARIERFLQLCDDDPLVYPTELALSRTTQDCNMQCIYPTTPANVFHALRRQIHRDFRKPLILFFSKSLLRHPLARSSIDDLAEGTRFAPYIPEPHPEDLVAPDQIKRHVLCTGQIYYQILQERESRGVKDLAISRIEQISPVPYAQLTPHLDKYPNAEIMWAQEEPINNGCWTYLSPRLRLACEQTENFKGIRAIKYAGRGPSSSVATGNKAAHKHEIERYLKQIFDY